MIHDSLQNYILLFTDLQGTYYHQATIFVYVQ